MTPNRVYKKLRKSLHTRDASQGMPDGKNIFFPLISNQSTTYSVYADVLAVLESNL